MLNGTKTIPNLHLSHLISIFLPQKFNLGNVYIEIVAISVCLIVCPIITQEPLDRFASNLDSGTQEIHEVFLAWF